MNTQRTSIRPSLGNMDKNNENYKSKLNLLSPRTRGVTLVLLLFLAPPSVIDDTGSPDFIMQACHHGDIERRPCQN